MLTESLVMMAVLAVAHYKEGSWNDHSLIVSFSESGPQLSHYGQCCLQAGKCYLLGALFFLTLLMFAGIMQLNGYAYNGNVEIFLVCSAYCMLHTMLRGGWRFMQYESTRNP